MITSAADLQARTRGASAPVLASTGMILFALLAHRSGPLFFLGVPGLLVAAVVMGRSLQDNERPLVLLGLGEPAANDAWVTALAVVAGAGLGMGVRSQLGLAAWPPGRLGAFAPLACVIGATEELVYRGWVQGVTARALGRVTAVVLAAAAHAAYKTALFAWPPFAVETEPEGLFIATFVAGLALGAARQWTGNILPPMAGHVAFDLVVYGSLVRAPWWVWG